MRLNSLQVLLFNVCCVPLVWAEDSERSNQVPEGGVSSAYDLCLLDKIKQQQGEQTVQSIRDECQLDIVSQTDSPDNNQENLAANRLKPSVKTAFEPFVMTAHRLNYLLPVTYSDNINDKAYEGTDWSEGLEHAEAEFQISFKFDIQNGCFKEMAYFLHDIRIIRQVYADDISRPFRETNYRPELFYGLQPLGHHLVVPLLLE